MLSPLSYADGRDTVEKPKTAAAKKSAKPAKKISKPVTGKPAPKRSPKVKRIVKQPAPADAKTVIEPKKNPAVKAEKKPGENNPPKPMTVSRVIAEPKPAPAPMEIMVMFESKPSNAEVVIDGFYAGSAPIQLPLKDGPHGVKIIYPGYGAWEKQIKPFKGMRVTALLEEVKPVVAITK